MLVAIAGLLLGLPPARISKNASQNQTSDIERFWSFAKRLLQKFNGVPTATWRGGAGWQLFDRVIAGTAAGPDGHARQRDEMCRQLEEKQTTIHVAHTLFEHVLPWGALYDRMYDPDRKTKDGEQVA